MKAAIIGYGKSGMGAEKLLKAAGFTDIDLYDDRIEGLKPVKDYKNQYDTTVVSPGVPFSKFINPPLDYTSEIELAAKYMSASAKIVAVTGTNGKSTVTHLCAQILNNMGVKAVACGNIGYPFADAVLEQEPDSVFVVELSSFQIELLSEIELSAAAIINLTPDHLDRYQSLEDYYGAKIRILDFIRSDGTLLSLADTRVVNKALSQSYKVQYVDSELSAWPTLTGAVLDFGSFSLDTAAYKLFGWHNLINLSFALGLATAVHPLEGDITNLIRDLEGMPWRTERVAEVEGVTWINDSKATNVDSTLIALKSCEYPTVLLLGGRDKRGDFTALVDEIDRCASLVCLFGEAASVIDSQLKGRIQVPMLTTQTLREATVCAAKFSKGAEDSVVILTPGCASFDEFQSFEDRGRKFVDYIVDIYFKRH